MRRPLRLSGWTDLVATQCSIADTYYVSFSIIRYVSDAEIDAYQMDSKISNCLYSKKFWWPMEVISLIKTT
jgi:hypothetical protein